MQATRKSVAELTSRVVDETHGPALKYRTRVLIVSVLWPQRVSMLMIWFSLLSLVYSSIPLHHVKRWVRVDPSTLSIFSLKGIMEAEHSCGLK